MPRRPRRKPGRSRAARAARAGRLRQLHQAFSLTRQHDPKMVPIVFGAALAVFAVLLLLGFLLGHPIIFAIFGVLFGILAGLSIFGRRAQGAAFAQVEGQPGASAAVVQSMRGMWLMDQRPVAVTRQSDVLFRVVGRPGIVLLGEGSAGRLSQLIGQEKRRVARVASDVPVYDVMVGNADGQVPLKRLQNHLMKLPRNLKPAQVRAVDGRLRALGTAQPPLPKGPMPRTARVPRGRMR